MIRTQVYLTEEEKKGLNRLSNETGIAQSELIRSAIDLFLENTSESSKMDRLKIMKGIWKDRKDLPDFSRMRKEFDRTNGR